MKKSTLIPEIYRVDVFNAFLLHPLNGFKSHWEHFRSGAFGLHGVFCFEKSVRLSILLLSDAAHF